MTEVFTGLTGDASAVLAAVRFVPRIGLELTTVPGGVAITSGGNPRRLMKAGWVSPSRVGVGASWPHTLFSEAARWVNFERQQFSYGQPGVYADRIRYHFEPGVIASLYVDDLADVMLPNSSLAPYDRGGAAWSQGARLSVAGGAVATMWTYTVPAGRILLVGNAEVASTRLTAATASVQFEVQMWRGSIRLLDLIDRKNTPFEVLRDTLAPGYLILLAGETISADYSNNDTGGTVLVNAHASGLLFNA